MPAVMAETGASARAQSDALLQDPGFLPRIAEQMHFQVREGKNIIRIQLKPADLGRLEIRAESSAGGLIATVLAESSGVKNFLEQNLHLLYRSLQDLGVKVDRVVVLQETPADHTPAHHGYHESRPDQEAGRQAATARWQPPFPEAAEDLPPVTALVAGVLRPHSTFHAVA